MIIENLRQKFLCVQDVQSATWQKHRGHIFNNTNADLVVQTWMGTRLHVHLITEELKLKDFRNYLKSNTSRSIGTLFLVRSDLLPDHGEQRKVPDWQEALAALNDGWIYAYTVTREDVQIRQVHFLFTALPHVFHCWHMSEFEIESVTVRNRELQSNIKGKWQIGDISSTQFKRKVNVEQRNYRYHYKTKHTRKIMDAPVDELRHYYEFLGIDGGQVSRSELKSAYRKMALQLHPDVSDLPVDEAERRFRELGDAYEFVKRFHDWN